jgi:hypothetical protein
MEREDEEYEVECIRNHDVIDNVMYYKVKWRNWPKKESTWEPDDNLANASRIVTKYWKGYQCKKSDRYLNNNQSDWNRYWHRHWRMYRRGRRTHREQIIDCLGATVDETGLWFVMALERGFTETMRLEDIKKRCPKYYANLIDSAFPQ